MLVLEVLEGTDKGRKIEIGKQEISIGRDNRNDLVINDIHVSSFHGKFIYENGKWFYWDNNSTNGSAVIRGDEKIVLGLGGTTNACEILDGSVVLIGSAKKPVLIGVSLGRTMSSSEIGHALDLVARIQDLEKYQKKISEDAVNLGRLYHVLCRLKWDLDLAKVMDSTEEAVFELLPKATHLCLALHDNVTNSFLPMLCSERGKGKTKENFIISNTIILKVIENKAAILVGSAPDEVGETESIMGAKILSTMATPLWSGEEIIGVLQVDNRDSAKIFKQDDLYLFLLLARQLSLAIQNALLYEKLQIAEKKLEGENKYLKGEEEKKRLTFAQCSSKVMAQVYDKAQKVKDTRVTVLIEGETGTGKEILASMIHYTSNRREKLFVAVNCAAMPESLLESELFGHKKGAFTGADRDKKGLFETADGGTMFLDEVTEMPISLQSKLLRVLQEGEIRPVGSTTSRTVDVRIIAATNRDIKSEVSAGRFREDLYYRLNVFPIRIPPLRERREDIPIFVNFFLQKYSRDFGKAVGGISQEAMNALSSYDWPGNIRELENEIQRLVLVVEPEQIITMEHLSSHIRKVEMLIEEVAPEGGTLRARMEEVEKWILINALKENGGNKSITARVLGISREGLHKKLQKYGL